MYRAHPAIVASLRSAGQAARNDATVGRQQADVFQHRLVGLGDDRKLVFACCRVGRQRVTLPVENDQCRGERMLQQAGDNPLVHAACSKNPLDAGGRNR